MNLSNWTFATLFANIAAIEMCGLLSLTFQFNTLPILAVVLGYAILAGDESQSRTPGKDADFLSLIASKCSLVANRFIFGVLVTLFIETIRQLFFVSLILAAPFATAEMAFRWLRLCSDQSWLYLSRNVSAYVGVFAIYLTLVGLLFMLVLRLLDMVADYVEAANRRDKAPTGADDCDDDDDDEPIPDDNNEPRATATTTTTGSVSANVDAPLATAQSVPSAFLKSRP